MPVTVDEQVHAGKEKDDTLTRATKAGRTTQRVSEQEVLAVLRQRDGG